MGIVSNKAEKPVLFAGIRLKAVKIFFDLLAVFAASVLSALTLQATESLFGGAFWMALGFRMACLLVFFLLFHEYRVSYTFFSVPDLLRLGGGLACTIAVELLACVVFEPSNLQSTVLYCLILAFFTCLLRFFRRLRGYLISCQVQQRKQKRVLIVGAGAAGMTLIKDLKITDKQDFMPVAIADDNPRKLGEYIYGVKVVGTIDQVPEISKAYKVSHIFVAIPSASPKELREILQKCQVSGVKVQTLPGLYQLASGTVGVSKVRDVDVQDLLGREPFSVDLDEITGYIENSVVLVTGGGGSIGSELCRQIATHRPRQLIVFDVYENNAYDIEQELKRRYSALNLLVLIGSVRDKGKMEDVFQKYRPDIVFNAAAHKHVPLMETSPNEAVKNNVFGTLNVARCSDKYKAKCFVQISTDKAVNPTNIMGATKRICEMIVQAIGRHSQTRFVAVRFGNVLGSNGSVIPLFKKQIAEGGPVTVTHKDIVRYFMTIPEAVSLVLQAGAYAKCGEIFVLDMGEQVRIYDLAQNLIRLSGLEPGKDIQIVCTGLRPGEKLYEERLMDEEGMQRTENKMINIGKPLEFDEELLFKKLDELYQAAYEETDNMKEMIHELVPTYRIDRR